MIDTAYNYRNQPLIARAIQDVGVSRENIFITSKVPGCLSFEETLKAAQQCLTELNTSYVDLLLVHFPNYNDTIGSAELRQSQWKAMEQLFHEGKTRAIGVSHHCAHHMRDILQVATVPIAANQVEYHVGMYHGADVRNVVNLTSVLLDLIMSN